MMRRSGHRFADNTMRLRGKIGGMAIRGKVIPFYSIGPKNGSIFRKKSDAFAMT
jgi:hypothetical protein